MNWLRSHSIPTIFVIYFTLISCGPSRENSVKKNTYPQNFKTDIAWITLEWNGKLYGYASGFLVDKEKGAFYTNKHVSDMFDTLGKGSHKVFFNGKVYNATIIKVMPLVDAALIKVTDSFDSSEFPEPAVIAKEKPNVGDDVIIQGFHVHSYRARESDEANGYSYPVVPILDDYYKMKTKNLDKERETIFERLEGVVMGVDVKYDVSTDENLGAIGNLREEANRYIFIKTIRDHGFSFGGLSGSAARNINGEIVGIVTRQNPREFVLDPEQTEKMDNGQIYLKQVFNSIYITPIESVDNLRQHLK